MSAKRQRGVHASPAKLQQALAASDLKTQTAVAERIADKEQLEVAPRGLVNKVFRGESVDPRSIERVASVLAVDAWTLYANGDSQLSEPLPKHTAEQHKKVVPFLFITAVVFILLLAGFLWRNSTTVEQVVEPDNLVENADPTYQSASTVIVLPIDSNHQTSINSLLSGAVNEHWRVMPNSLIEGVEEPDPQLLLDNGLAQRVLTGRLQQQGRWLSLNLFLHKPGAMQSTWQTVLPNNAGAQRIGAELRSAAQQVVTEVSLSTASLQAQKKYLEGRYYLDQARNESNVRRALNEFESALRSDSEFALAYAGLCEALILEHIRTGDLSRLEEAIPQCAKALALEPNNLEALRSQAYLDRKRGNIQASLTGFTQVLQASPNNVDALLGIADVYVTQYQRAADEQAYANALAAVEKANALEPDFWKTYYSLARILYLGGNIDAAVNASIDAVNSNKNLLTLNNLGTYKFCQGDYVGARDAYQQILSVDPNSYLGTQQPASMNYYLGNFEAAAKGFRAALNLQERSGSAEDHRIWGNYADALRHAGKTSEAISSYGKAIALVEQDILKGDRNTSDDIAKAYYYDMLSLTDPEQIVTQRLPLEELKNFGDTGDPRFVLYLAIMYLHRGDYVQAEKFRDKSAVGCPGLAQSPDYVGP